VTGKIIHIDFGDCFEVAMHREKYPERVPFRLTRMLTFAMEVSNIEGSFRTTCEHVMRLLRDNKESLMAVLEAFVHDPLLTWRLNTRDSPPEPSFPSERRTSIMGTGAMAPQPDNAVGGRRGSVMGGTAAAATDPHEQRPGSSYRAPQRNRLSSAAPPNAGGHHGAAATGDPVEKEVQNARALQVLSRVKEKLTGRDFKKTTELPVEEQVEKLLSEATNLENLCQHYIGVSLPFVAWLCLFGQALDTGALLTCVLSGARFGELDWEGAGSLKQVGDSSVALVVERVMWNQLESIATDDRLYGVGRTSVRGDVQVITRRAAMSWDGSLRRIGSLYDCVPGASVYLPRVFWWSYDVVLSTIDNQTVSGR